ncbi:MAG TPA: insulinase family protein [Caulobacteraceae bacterium]|nr:insulinase family protein [Caulobacteraceae bacterium]
MALKFWRGLWLSLVMLAAAPSMAAPAQPRAPQGALARDPEVIRGTLPNGLRYAIMRNSHPAGGVSFRLGIAVGSLDETDDERGGAHFIEHLAANGADGMSEADLNRLFASAGVAFGRDRNAETGYRATTYRIDLPKADSHQIDLALGWLRHAADAAVITQASVDHERGVILAERETRLTSDHATDQTIARFMLGGLRLVDREPIGTLESLQAMTPARLADFYRRWYGPRNAVLVIVGDQPVAQMHAALTKAFGSWEDSGPPPTRPSLGTVGERRGLQVLTLAEPSAGTVIRICRVQPGEPEGDSVADLAARTRRSLWAATLQQRLTRLAEDPSSGLVGAAVSAESPDVLSAKVSCVSAIPAAGAVQPAVATVAGEIGRFASGPNDDELRQAIMTQESKYRGAVVTAETRQSEMLATQFLNAELQNRVIASPAEAMRAYEAVARGLYPGDIAAAFHADWAGAGPIIAVTTPTPIARTTVADLWMNGVARPATRPLPALGMAWAYDSFGAPGELAHRETFDKPRFTRFTFANGVVLNVMHTDFDRNVARVEIVFGHGLRQVSRSDYLAAATGASFFKLQGLGRHGFERVSELFRDNSWGADLTIFPDVFRLDGIATSQGLSTQLKILAAYVSDPGFRDIDSKVKTALGVLMRSYESNPTAVAAAALNAQVEPGNPEGPFDPKALAQLDSKTFARVLGPILAQSPIEVSIAGDVDEDEVYSLVASTFGALPPRRSPLPDRPDAWFMRYPASPAPPTLWVRHDGPPEKAAAIAVWPLWVARPERRREEYAVTLVAAILNDRLLQQLREAQGKTYAPRAEATLPDFGDQGELGAIVETSPSEAEAAAEGIRKAAQQLARGEISSADLEAVRGPKLAELAHQAQTTAYWLAAISTSSRAPTSLDDALDAREIYGAITLEEVRKAAADWLSRAPWVVIATPRTATHLPPKPVATDALATGQ